MKTEYREASGRRADQAAQPSPRGALVSTSVTELLGRARIGDQAAWDEIMRRFHRLVLAKVRSFRLQDADAQDAVQMTWLRLVENQHRILFPDQLGRWLGTTASRECQSILRDAKRFPDLNDPAMDRVADPAAGPEHQAIHRDDVRTLYNLVAELAPRERVLLEALFSDDPPRYVELARITRIPTGSIGPTRARALRRLRQKLEASPPRCRCGLSAPRSGPRARV